jgi:hypothetical protein
VTTWGGGPGGPAAGSVDEALSALADVLEARADAIAAQVEEAYVEEIPEYRGRLAKFQEDSYLVTRAGVVGAAAVLRDTVPPREQRVTEWRAFGRRRAQQDFPLSAVVHAFQVGVRVFIEHVAEEAPRFGGLSGAVVLRAVSDLMDVVTDGVACVSEAYEAARQEAEAGRRRAVDAFFSDLVLGMLSENDSARATAMGLDPAPSYAAFATPLGADEDLESMRQATGDGCLWGRVGNVAVMITPLPATAVDDVATIAARMFAPSRLVAGGERGAGLAGVRTSYEDALQALEMARRLGLSGTVTRRDVLVPGLLAASPFHAAELAGLLEPLVEADRHGEARLLPTLRAYLANGMSAYKAAAALFVHRNTLRARLRRIEQLLGAPIVEIHLALQLGLLAHDLDVAQPSREIP